MKKVYFACSIRGGRDDQPIYAAVVGIIKTNAEVLSEMFTNKDLTARGYEGATDHWIWKADLELLKKADAVITEVTNPSLGVGYEIAEAKNLKKPVLALYRPQPDRRLSAMVAGDPNVQVIEYQDVSELKQPIADFLQKL